MVKNKVKYYREQKDKSVEFNLTKAHLGRRIGVSSTYISRLEKGHIVPSLEKAHKLAQYFNCLIEDLFPYSQVSGDY